MWSLLLLTSRRNSSGIRLGERSARGLATLLNLMWLHIVDSLKIIKGWSRRIGLLKESVINNGAWRLKWGHPLNTDWRVSKRCSDGLHAAARKKYGAKSPIARLFINKHPEWILVDTQSEPKATDSALTHHIVLAISTLAVLLHVER